MEGQFTRTINLIGHDLFQKIQNANILVFGVGGVGGFVVETLARAGVKNFTIVDNDVVDISNINRQIIALYSTIGKSKVQVMKQRVLDINPNANVNDLKLFVTKDNLQNFDFSKFDYVVDAIDNVTAKIELARLSEEHNFNLISCMGTGNKLCPEKFVIDDINKTSVCPLARVIRKKLKELGVKKLCVLYSTEQPKKTENPVPATISFTPSIAGIKIAEFVIKELIK